MTSAVVRLTVAGLAVLAVSCSRERSVAPPDQQAALGGEVAARVGTDVVPLSLVIKVATAQHIAPREALKRLVDDAVVANAARAKGLDRELPGSWSMIAVRGRVAADRIFSDAKKLGPPTDAEIDAMTKRYWREVDRPPSIRVVHAVVRRSAKPDPALDARAKAFAEELRTAVVDAKDGDDFMAKAKAVPHPGLDVIVQPLAAFAQTGDVVEGEGKYDDGFTKGAWAILSVGDTSPIVESYAGWHVIKLIERLPEQRMSREARRAAFTEEAYVARARAATAAVVQARKALVPVEIAPSAEQVMRSLLETPGRGPTP
jgi:peptidyl-prolyl cis-trans isomerase C